jgi:BolA protein
MSRQTQIQDLLNNNFDVEFLEVLNESHMHSVPPNSETHFKVTVVSADFEGKSKVARHQSIYALLGNMMQEGLHALALHLYLPSEWSELREGKAPDSPNCMGGSK